jgi:branched-chain amino acid transport system substrate-binding protein
MNKKMVLLSIFFLCLWAVLGSSPALLAADRLTKANASFDAGKLANMSDFDPGNPVIPTGDTIKIAVVASFSGPASQTGPAYFTGAQWAAHDINKRGGIFVDGKKKLVEIIKADSMGKPDQCKRISEQMILQNKVHVLLGTDGGHLMKVINMVADKYKVIALNISVPADELMDKENFSRYAFMTNFSNNQTGPGLAYYYGKIRKKEKKFYVLCADYAGPRQLAEAFKKGLKEFYPEAQLVGEDYHKLFLTDYAPYFEKIRGSGAEVVFTSAWGPDVQTMLKQARQMGVTVPFANMFMDDPNALNDVGVEGTAGMVFISQYLTANPQFKTPEQIKYFKTWNDLWKTKWKTNPYNTLNYEYFQGGIYNYAMGTYWLLDVMARAKSTNPEKIIPIWENDTYKTLSGKIVRMRGCDHKMIQDMAVSEFVPPNQQKVSYNIPPYYWYKNASFYGPTWVIPAANLLPWMDQNLDRCKGKNGWGE